MRKKVLIAALAALGALAVTAGAAHATNQWMTGGNVNAKAIGDQVSEEAHVFGVEGAGTEIRCKNGHFEGRDEVASPATQIVVVPTYANCQAFLGLTASVTNEGCDLLFEIGKTLAPGLYQVTVTLRCASGKKIVVEAGTCKGSVGGEQFFKTTLSYKNNGGSPEKGLLSAEASGIKVNKEKDGFLCPLSGTGKSAPANSKATRG